MNNKIKYNQNLQKENQESISTLMKESENIQTTKDYSEFDEIEFQSKICVQLWKCFDFSCLYIMGILTIVGIIYLTVLLFQFMLENGIKNRNSTQCDFKIMCQNKSTQ
jgi:hypothetical protein